jgi:serine/threonine protein kinase/Tfp pilus assembly protein PilF
MSPAPDNPLDLPAASPGGSVAPEEVLRRWPADPRADGDVASALFADLLRRRAGGQESSVEDLARRFPEHEQSLAGLISQPDFLRSVGVESSARRCLLRLPEVGDELFGFRFRAELGRGAFARVLLAEQIDLAGRPVAVKVSAIEGNEPRTLAQMQHPHIVPIYSVQEDARTGLRAVCMPYLGGATLARVMQQVWADGQLPVHGRQLADALERAGSAFPPPGLPAGWGGDGGQTPLAIWRGKSYVGAATWVVARLAEGLHHAHQCGVLHRDVKPSNILLGADGQPLLLDFNLARQQHGDPAEAALGGTVAYMAPEHMRAMARRTPAMESQVDQRADVYSLGMVLYEMLAGRKPFEQSASYSVVPLQLEAMAAERSKEPASLRACRRNVPWGLESILRRCLAPNPAQRYQQAEHLAEDLRCFLEDRPLRHAPELSRKERVLKWARRHPRWAWAAAVTLIVGVVLGLAGTAYAAAQAAQEALAGAKEELDAVQNDLAGTSKRLDTAQAEQRKRDFASGTVRALCLVSTVGPSGHLPEGARACESTLAIYDVLSGATWQEPSDWRLLSDDERRSVAEDARELLLLLADVCVRQAHGNELVLRQALRLLERAESIPGLSSSRALWIDRARYLTSLGEAGQAQDARRQALEMPVTTARDHYLLATALARRGGPGAFAAAVAELDKALALNPRHYWSWFQRGLCHTELGELVLAAGDFSHCTSLGPEFAWGHVNLGFVQAEAGKLSEAVASYNRALEHEPDHIAARRNRAQTYLALQRYREALADLDQLSKQGEHDATLHASRGIALEGLGQHQKADAAFRLAFAEAAKLPAATRLRMRWTYGFAVARRRPLEARRAFEEVLREDARHAQALYGLAMLAMEQGDGAAAIRHFDRAIEAAPQFFDARRYRAIQRARLGDLKGAREDVDWCMDKEPRSGASLYASACVLALASRQRNDPRLAEQARERLELAFTLGVGQDKADADPDLTGLRARPDLWKRALQAKARSVSPR